MINIPIRRRWVSRMLALLLALFAAPVISKTMAQSASEMSGAPMSLKQCIAYALRNDGNIKIARFDEYIAEQQVREFTSVGLPQVTGNAQYQHHLKLPVTLIDAKNFPGAPAQSDAAWDATPDVLRFPTAQFGVKYNLSLGGQVTQLLYDGSFFVGLKAARELVALNHVNIERSKIEAAVAVTKAYYSALLAEEQARVLTSNLVRLRKLLANTAAMYKEGFVEKVDVDRLKIAVNNLSLQKEKVGRMVGMGYDLLKFQMGLPLESEIALVDRISDLDDVPNVESLIMEGSFANNRVEMDLMRRNIHLNELNVKRYQIGFTGTLAAFGNVNYQTFRPRFFDLNLDKNWFFSSFWGLSYNVTIFDGFNKRSNVMKGRLEIRKIQTQMEMFEQGVELEVRSASSQVLNAWSDVQTARENKELSEEVYRISTTKYQEGIGSNLEVIDAENTLMESQINFLSALYDYMLADVELRRAKGEIMPFESNNIRK